MKQRRARKRIQRLMRSCCWIVVDHPVFGRQRYRYMTLAQFSRRTVQIITGRNLF